uniref:Uncharacterized protein n=1 Tax=Trichobilharzia regenti TaxID=157069 RepID=A0AA85J467_TRIRE|nr:unnamed protein product [Trichobilharzia regenti]
MRLRSLLDLVQECNFSVIDQFLNAIEIFDEIKRRITECLSKPQQELDASFWEAEYQSLSRLLQNHHQNNYTLPSGLGGSRSEPAVAATGADLKECRRILSESETVKNSLLTRIISKFVF